VLPAGVSQIPILDGGDSRGVVSSGTSADLGLGVVRAIPVDSGYVRRASGSVRVVLVQRLAGRCIAEGSLPSLRSACNLGGSSRPYRFSASSDAGGLSGGRVDGPDGNEGVKAKSDPDKGEECLVCGALVEDRSCVHCVSAV